MEIVYFDSLPSTQTYLIEKLENNVLQSPVSVITKEQNSGLGSRENHWSGGEGNFFASIALDMDTLPSDLPLASASIYFSFIMKKTLEELGEKVMVEMA